MSSTHPLPPSSLLASNAKWAKKFASDHPGFFEASAAKQAPQALWIGCADSRVPESVVLNVNPGVIFTHRNIANQVHLGDDNVRAVIDYAIDHLAVRQVWVVGHTGCGGVEAAYDAANKRNAANEPLDRWLHDLVQLVLKHHLNLKPKKDALPLIVLENIKAQVNNVYKAPSIIKAIASGKAVQVKGLLYDLKDGRLTDLNITGVSKL